MTDLTPLRTIFEKKITRDIPPVVYFHDQAPQRLAEEVSEYIITGGWDEAHPNHKRVPRGIHEEYVRLLTAIADELERPGGPTLPTAWISGFYGSGKSSFAKLLGLVLDGVTLPDGRSLAEAWLAQNKTDRRDEHDRAWKRLRGMIDPIAVVFDVGSIGRGGEQVHTVALNQVQRRLGYCATDPLVADFELRLERDGEYERFCAVAESTLGAPWAEHKDTQMADDAFSQVMSAMFPDRFETPLSWLMSRGGTHTRSESPEEAAVAIRDMLEFRHPGATLFLVVDEVSQFVLANKDRVDRLRAFATALGGTLKGKTWLLALGQQKLDEDADDSFLVWARDRFPPKLRVHLAATNIRDVVHRRLLQKTDAGKAQLRDLFERHRPDLKLYAYGCDSATPEEFVETYPLLPGQIDLILQLTTALRSRSSRAQGDDQAIRGLLQLLGELFREQQLANAPVGSLITLDQIYEVQHTALDSDIQDSMARLLANCKGEEDELARRAAKAVALLELIQESLPTDAKLVARCLFDRVDRGNQVPAVTEALESLRRRSLLGYSEKHGYKIQSSAGEEWDRERKDIAVPHEKVVEIVQEALQRLLAMPERPKHEGRPFPWAGVFSDGRRVEDAILADPRDPATVRVDFRFLRNAEDRAQPTWVKRSDETTLQNRLVWVVGDTSVVDARARELYKSKAMVRRYRDVRASLNAARKMLLQQEENRVEELDAPMREGIASAWMLGQMYFRGRAIKPSEHGAAFATSLHAVGARILPDLFPQFVPTQVTPGELEHLLNDDLAGPPPKFTTSELGILDLDGGRYVPASSGVVPRRIADFIEEEQGISGGGLIAHFGAPPYGYTDTVVKACVAGLMRASRVLIQPDGGPEVGSRRDAGARDVLTKDRSFRRATIVPAGDDEIGPKARARICKFFEQRLNHVMDREDDRIADAVQDLFPGLAGGLREVQANLNRLPGRPAEPGELAKLAVALEQCLRASRQTKLTVQKVKRHLQALNDGVHLLRMYQSALRPEAIAAVVGARRMVDVEAQQLAEVGIEPTTVTTAGERIVSHLESERPWREVADLESDLDEIRRCYVAERRRVLEDQEALTVEARSRVKHREGFSTLSADDSHRVLRPLRHPGYQTTAEAVAPTLRELRDSFELALIRAEDEANEILDQVLIVHGKRPIITLDARLKNREVGTPEELDALLKELRERIAAKLEAGVKVRLR